MKKLLLSIAVVVGGFAVNAQVITAGVSPASIQGNYVFTWAEGADWSTPDFLIPGLNVIDTLDLADDGSTGTNPQGNPVSAEACNPLINDLTGKIAVVYRNTCEFGAKALNAQNAGAEAVIIINRENETVAMGGGADGLSVTIPVVMISNVDGAALIAEMANGPVVMFIGNKLGAFNDDIGANSGQLLVSPYGAANARQFDGFDLGIQIYNFGNNMQSDITVQATIDGPGGNVYDQTVGPFTMNTGDTNSIFVGNTDEFPPFNLGGIGNYPNGLYTLTYDLQMGATDESDFDNSFTSTFSVVDDLLSLANVNSSGEPVSNTYPSNSVSGYESCMVVQEPNASTMATNGMWIVPFADTAAGDDLAGEEIFAIAYQWDDAWVDLDDINFDFAGATSNAFDNLNILTIGTYVSATNNDIETPQFVEFPTAFQLQDNVRYLFCAQTLSPERISLGYDNTINYNGNEGIFRQPTSPVLVDDGKFIAGWAGVSAPSHALGIFDPSQLGLNENKLVGTAFPNPANDNVSIEMNAEGTAQLTVIDIAGKIALHTNITLVNGTTQVDVSSLVTGVYTFNVALESGEVSIFSVVKN